ncbi:GSCFA domain-containing protein [Robertkochia solimangrovi]|uniref:GSCFA domain-containing protein n=1 Tax=Robertkochia solimangrovi TaxID=2213046 RepID=UPI00117DC98C|nr:GSCFA domain-containing protein [Robertkochia solimangrovi]TRZ43104.1 hypothetical protein DMZ48_10430 [Robertkochia solimangrovi]
MKLQTIIKIKEAELPITYKNRVLLMGSCFVENIGTLLQYHNFQTEVNPFGIIFNPESLAVLFESLIDRNSFDYVPEQGRWHCLQAHSRLSAASQESLEIKVEMAMKSFKEWLVNADTLILTLGTAWVYTYLESGNYVANCHKIAQTAFEKELLSTKKIIYALERIEAVIRRLNPSMRVIATISPVRHLKDGFVENQQSKSHLITALHYFVGQKKTVELFSFL